MGRYTRGEGTGYRGTGVTVDVTDVSVLVRHSRNTYLSSFKNEKGPRGVKKGECHVTFIPYGRLKT